MHGVSFVSPAPQTSPCAVVSLQLRNFRSYEDLIARDLDEKFVVLAGNNGAGKTNLLEAISLLSPGRGLRGVDTGMLQNAAHPAPPWSIAAHIQTEFGVIPIGTGRDPEKSRRLIRIKGETARNQASLSEYLSCLWLTPQMDRLFLDAASGRRRFLDRMIFAFDPAHAGRVTRYENALAQRARLLREGRAEPSWIGGLETQMAESGISIAAARVDFIERLQGVGHRRGGDHFPVADVALSGFLEDRLFSGSALQVEEIFLETLQKSRGQDALTGGASVGPHRTDLLVTYHAKAMPAAHCSTGEQKALLIGLILSHADLLQAEKGASTILLLDEVAAHLDEARRAALFDTLRNNGGQVWMTGTDMSLFSALDGQGTFLRVDNGHLIPLTR